MLQRRGVCAAQKSQGARAPSRTLLLGRTYRHPNTRTICKAINDSQEFTITGTLRVWAVSDLHTHHPDNAAWVQLLGSSSDPHQEQQHDGAPEADGSRSGNHYNGSSNTSSRSHNGTATVQGREAGTRSEGAAGAGAAAVDGGTCDVLIVAGDISDDLDDVRVALTALKRRFPIVFFCPGNHELWVHGNHGRSHANASANSTTPATGFQSASGSNSHTTITSNSNGSSDNTTSSSSITISSSSMDSNESGDGGDGKHAAGVTSGPPDGAAAAAVAVAWDSVGKLHAVLQLCGELGVEVRPRRVGRLAVVPLLAWHHQAFDQEPDIPGIPRASPLTITDYARCVWPPDLGTQLHAGRQQQGQLGQQQAGQGQGQGQEAAPATSVSHGSCTVAAWFDSLNDLPNHQYDHLLGGRRTREAVQRVGTDTCCGTPAAGGGTGLHGGVRAGEDQQGNTADVGDAGDVDVISFSHFLPIQELLPEKRYLTFPNLAKAVGSRFLGDRVRQLRPDVHVFGHTHFAWDAHHDGIRYLQAPLAYPSERRMRPRSLTMAPRHTSSGSDSSGGSSSSNNGALPSPAAPPPPSGPPSDVGRTAAAADSVAAAAAAAAGSWPSLALRAPHRGLADSLDGSSATATAQAPVAAASMPASRSALPPGASGTAPDGVPLSEQRNSSGNSSGSSSSSSATGSQAQPASPSSPEADPEAASWLPLCVYTADVELRVRVGQGHGQGHGSVQAGSGGKQQQQEQPQGFGSGAAPLHADPAAGGSRPGQQEALVAPLDLATLLQACGSLSRTSSQPLTVEQQQEQQATGPRGHGLVAPSGAGLGAGVEVEVAGWRSAWCPEQRCMWSLYYKRNARNPQELQLAPWVAERYSRRRRRTAAKQAAAAAADTGSLASAGSESSSSSDGGGEGAGQE